MVCQNDTLLGLPHHGAMNCCLVGIVRSQSVFDVSAVNTNKSLIKKSLADVLLGHISDEREPVTAQTSAGHRDFDVGQMAKFHRNVNRVSNDGNPFAMT